MASMTLSDFQTEVRLTLENMQTSDPWGSTTFINRAINDAPNRLIRMVRNADLFPEKHNTWTVGLTTVGENEIELPSDLIILKDVTSADTSSLPDWAATKEIPVSPVPLTTISFSAKTSSTTGYPRLYARKAKKIVYYPTTQTGYTTYLRFYGVAREAAISNSSDSFTISEDWDSAIVKLAAEYIARRAGWTERADELLADAKGEIGEQINIMGAERAANPTTFVSGMTPR